ncbi:hypothetical protein AAIR29_07315 [Psychrobacter sp. FBL11]|uniref:Uncharacterized protein n=1 Tax=Psychrobacter saeujeotis TaxID=3143436 RepID=A0ABU9X7R6_9GAMM|nr:hypothetical protein [uncultured Psychrobacter sp.]
MRNYLNLFSTKARLLCLGSALVLAPVTSTFAILPMMSQVFEPSSVNLLSANEEKLSTHYNDVNFKNSNLLTSNQSRAENYATKYLVSDIERIPALYLRERTIIMKSTL